MDIQTFLTAVRQNAARIRDYQLGCDGSGGVCDCIGLIIGALRLTGAAWNGTHGSNYAARYAMQSLDKIKDKQALIPGQLVFKCREKGEQKYALPSRYHAHEDDRDYYHVGVVMETQPLCIFHCSGGGKHQDTRVGEWQYAGFLQGIEPVFCTVHSENGGSVNMREKPDLSARRVGTVQPGEQVLWLQAAGDAWAQVHTEEGTGYMMRKFLQKEGGSVHLTLDEACARTLYQALAQALKFS